MAVVLSRLRRALRAADSRTAYVRSATLGFGLALFAFVQFTVFPRQGITDPFGLLLELSVVVAAVGGVVAFDFLREKPSIYRPIAVGLVLIGVSGVTDLLADFVRHPLWFDLIFENLTFVLGIGAFLVAISHWSKDQSRREERLQRRNERLDAFASVVSHDLRNPLQVAQASSEAAREDGEQAHFDRLDRSLDRMEAIVDDVLEFARVGGESASLGVLQYSSIAEKAWETVDANDATLVVEDDGTISADSSLLLQALENLFRNAIDHGGPGVEIRTGVDKGWIYVADDGPGIAAAERERVMESGYSTAADGTGFGLAIVQTVADAHDWEVRVAESETGGARFELGPVRANADRR